MREPEIPACLDRRNVLKSPGGLRAPREVTEVSHGPERQSVTESRAGVCRDDPELSVIAGRIRGRTKRASADIIEMGNDLILAKRKLSRGAFGPWLEDQFGWTDRTARAFMAVATLVSGKTEKFSVLQPSTLYLLARPSTPVAIVDDILADVGAGRAVYHHLVRARIEEANKKARAAKASRPASIRPSVPVGELAVAGAWITHCADKVKDEVELALRHLGRPEHPELFAQLRGVIAHFERSSQSGACDSVP